MPCCQGNRCNCGKVLSLEIVIAVNGFMFFLYFCSHFCTSPKHIFYLLWVENRSSYNLAFQTLLLSGI